MIVVQEGYESLAFVIGQVFLQAELHCVAAPGNLFVRCDHISFLHRVHCV